MRARGKKEAPLFFFFLSFFSARGYFSSSVPLQKGERRYFSVRRRIRVGNPKIFFGFKKAHQDFKTLLFSARENSIKFSTHTHTHAQQQQQQQQQRQYGGQTGILRHRFNHERAESPGFVRYGRDRSHVDCNR